MESSYQESFLALIRMGIGHSIIDLPKDIDWNAVQNLAVQQGLTAIVIDGIEKLPYSLRPPKEVLLEWIGQVLHEYENRYELYRRTIAEMAGFYNSHGLKMMVLKGFACSLDWPKPGHRPAGDIDIWQFGEYKKADALITKEKGIKVNSNEHHHTVFYLRGFMVENHYDFINVHHHRSNAQIEKILKSLSEDDSHFVYLLGEKVYIPSPNLHALFLLRHAIIEFAACGLNFRQVLDWALYVKKHGDKIDWEWLLTVLEEFHMRDFIIPSMQSVWKIWGLILTIIPIFNIVQVLKIKCSMVCSFPNLMEGSRRNCCLELSGKCAAGKRTNGSINYVTMKVCGVHSGAAFGLTC